MNKAKLCEKLAERVGLTKKQCEDVIDTFEEITIEELKKGETVTLTGFGTFRARKRESRMGVNPQNPSEKIRIPTVIVPKFKAGKKLKDSLKEESSDEASEDKSSTEEQE